MDGDTGFATGLLSGINANIARQRDNQNAGDKAQFEAFQEASREYQSAKDKVSDQANKIDAMARILSGVKPDAAAYSTARDAVEMGYTGPEHLSYVQDAYQHTKQDMINNPDKWNVSPNAPVSNDNIVDSNPTQTNAIHKFSPNMPLSDIENVRQHNLQRPYNNLPGASWGNPENVANKLVYDKAAASQKAKADAENANMGWGDMGGSQGVAPSAAPQAQADGGQGNVNTALPLPNGGTGSVAPPPQGGQPQPQGQGAPAPQGQPPAGGQPPQQGGGNVGVKDQVPANPDVIDYTKAPEQPTQGLTRGEQVSGVGLNREFLKTLPPLIQGQVQGIANGTMKPPQGMGEAAIMFRQKMLAAVKQYDPSFDETTFAARQAASRDLNNPNSKVGQQMISVNRLAQHMDKLDQSIDQLPNLHSYDSAGPWYASNKGPPLVTGLENQIGRTKALMSGGKDAQAYATFETNKKAVVDEMTRLWRGTGGNKADIEERAKELDSANTPEQLHAALAASVGLIHGQIDPLQDNMDRVLGPHSRDILAPKTRAIFDRLEGRQQGQEQQPQGAAQPSPQPQGTRGGGTPDYSALWNGGGNQ